MNQALRKVFRSCVKAPRSCIPRTGSTIHRVSPQNQAPAGLQYWVGHPELNRTDRYRSSNGLPPQSPTQEISITRPLPCRTASTSSTTRTCRLLVLHLFLIFSDRSGGKRCKLHVGERLFMPTVWTAFKLLYPDHPQKIKLGKLPSSVYARWENMSWCTRVHQNMNWVHRNVGKFTSFSGRRESMPRY